MTSDAQLLVRIANKDEHALIAFHRRYVNLVYSMAMQVLSNTADAEEATQDVFLVLWRRAATYNPKKGAVTSWLLTIARNKAIDRLRRRRGLDLRSQPIEPLAEYLSVNSGQDDEIPSADLSAAMTMLPAAQQQVIQLIYFEGYTHREVAAMLDIPTGTVKGRVRLAMEKFRRYLSDEEPADDEEAS